MTFDDFNATLADREPPSALPAPLKALWQAARGDWDEAHRIAQDIDSKTGAWIHAYLHRKEGDLSNAGYWYHQAGHPVAHDSLEEEWKRIVTTLLE
jgi:hypothetical protein